MIGGSAMKNNLIVADWAQRRIGIIPEVDCTDQIINPLFDSAPASPIFPQTEGTDSGVPFFSITTKMFQNKSIYKSSSP